MRSAAFATALLAGARETDIRLARTLSYGVSGYGAFVLLMSAAAAETAVTPAGPMLAQSGSQAYPGGSLIGLFNSGGLLGEFAAGFLGSGVLGVLFGRGLLGGLGSVPSYLGLAFQLALLATLGRLIWTRWHGGDAASPTVLSPRQLAEPYLRSRDDLHAGIDVAASGNEAAATDVAHRDGGPSELTDAGKCK
ncbi:MAG: hypothetical protein ACRECV_03725 [Xanthobacteraceae bacterium]